MATISWYRKGLNLVFRGKSGAVQYGSYHASAAGTGLPLSATKLNQVEVYTDDAGTALTAATYNSLFVRLLLTAAANVSAIIAGIRGHVVATANTVATWCVGVLGYVQPSGATVGSIVGVVGRVDVPSTCIISANKIVAALAADSSTLAGTHTGTAVPIWVPNPGAGTWDGLAVIGSACGAIATKSSHLSSLDAAYRLLVFVPGVGTLYIPLVQTWT